MNGKKTDPAPVEMKPMVTDAGTSVDGRAVAVLHMLQEVAEVSRSFDNASSPFTKDFARGARHMARHCLLRGGFTWTEARDLVDKARRGELPEPAARAESEAE